MSGRAKKPAAPRKKANGYKMPAPIPNGEVIHDTVMKKKWRIGPSIGVGGFGEIYSACDHESSPKKGSSYPYVIKIEPHENGPLFVEKHFYIRNCNKDEITKFMKLHKLSNLGMPSYYGNGTHDYNGEQYRYLVLERYGKDLWTVFIENGRQFPAATVFQIGLLMLDTLAYIHSRGYVHADLKGANILLGLKDPNQTYLVDFGLATRVKDKEFKPDPKCAHNGTIEYTSRDAHLGVPTMRGDLEILAYNMLQWIVGALPWERNLTQPKVVQDAKEGFMKHVRANIAKMGDVPEALIKFFEYINSMKPKDTPDYTKCRNLFESYLESQGKTLNSKLEFTAKKTTSKGKKTKAEDSQDDSVGSPRKKATKRNGEASSAKRGKKAEDSQDESVESPRKKITKANGEVSTAKRGKKAEDSQDESVGSPRKKITKANGEVSTAIKRKKAEDSQDESVGSSKKKITKANREASTAKRGIKAEDSTDESAGSPRKKAPTANGEACTVKRGRKPAIVEPSDSESVNENEEPEVETKKAKKVIRLKRKSTEPLLVVKKKGKLTPKITPPVKRNYANIATQTSVDRKRKSPRQVSFDSPICEIIGDTNKKSSLTKQKNESINSSGDIFEDSFVIENNKVKPKKKLLSIEDIVVKKVVKKKTTSLQKKSWKDSPAIVNGRSPPK